MTARGRAPAHVPKILGADVELGNCISGMALASGSADLAARLLLRQIPGIHARGAGVWGGQAAQDWGRRFLPGNGGCAYIDLDHLELALPETATAFDFVAYWRAMLDTAREALARVNDELPPGQRAHAFANCSDGLGHAYGAHMNVLITRTAYNNLLHRKPHYLGFLAAFQASSLVFTGAGKVGAENGRAAVDFQLSQRSDFIETLVAEQTTFRRPLVNTRDEPLCGRSGHSATYDPELARLHLICFDATLCSVATLLRAGTLQIVASMIEAEVVDPRLALDDALEALDGWSHDPSLMARARLVDGTEVTAVELQQRFVEAARAFADSHGFGGIVPRAGEVLDLWDDTIRRLHAQDFTVLARRVDWVLKRQILEHARATRSLDWSSPEMRHLDQMYASIDPADGLFMACEHAGLVDAVVEPEHVARARRDPPADTRAWTRAHLLRLAGPDRIDEVDWDAVAVRVETRRHRFASTSRRVVHLPYPYAGGRADGQNLFSAPRSLEEVVERLGGDEHGDRILYLPAPTSVS